MKKNSKSRKQKKLNAKRARKAAKRRKVVREKKIKELGHFKPTLEDLVEDTYDD